MKKKTDKQLDKQFVKNVKWAEKENLKRWHWPFLRVNMSGAKEYACPHGIGHGGIHGCDGCCRSESFPR